MPSLGRSWGDTPPAEPRPGTDTSRVRRFAALGALLGVMGVAGLAGAGSSFAATGPGSSDDKPPTHQQLGRTWA